MPVSEHLEISIQLGLVFYHPTYSSSHCNFLMFIYCGGIVTEHTRRSEDNSGGQFSPSMWTQQLLQNARHSPICYVRFLSSSGERDSRECTAVSASLRQSTIFPGPVTVPRSLYRGCGMERSTLRFQCFPSKQQLFALTSVILNVLYENQHLSMFITIKTLDYFN